MLTEAAEAVVVEIELQETLMTIVVIINNSSALQDYLT
jgi:hypothetical protein